MGAHSCTHMVSRQHRFGPASLTMARVFQNQNQLSVAGDRGAAMTSLNLDSIHAGHSRTYSSSSFVTDSAAGATAYSCGLKTINRQIGTDNQARACSTLMEAAKRKGMKTGIAVTSSVTDASPASFSSHSLERNCHKNIASQQAISRVADVLLGGGRKFFTSQSLTDLMQTEQQGRPAYSYCADKTCMESVTQLPVVGLFAEGDLEYEMDRLNDPSVRQAQPSLSEMANKAVELLNKDNEKGFFLFVEGSKIDKAIHPNDVASHLREILEYDKTVGAMKSFADQDGQTLIISTSDHETGGLTLGRGTMWNPDGISQGAEAPLRTESFSSGRGTNISFQYEYLWYPEQLANVTKSATAMARDTVLATAAAAGVNDLDLFWAQVQTDPTLQNNLVQTAAAQLQGHSSWSLLADELELFQLAVTFDGTRSDREYALLKSFGSCAARRSHIGFTTWGHTGVDVNLYSHGPGSEQIRGSLENSQVGNIIASLMGVDLAQETVDMADYLSQINLTATLAGTPECSGWY
eukprot:TRINITY_DN2817_c0_g1_i3.p1 TRINITY_DN2817_c0_g1~~TRINITY_DN2817_c0_g1_i3.p1  ORF type:complete len:522 (-),score=110.15 TRINITY_DN2817_c0_g1_i3:59-1624(-)